MRYLVLILFFSITRLAFSQDNKLVLSGKVLNGTKPLYNVTIVNTTKTLGSVTEDNGDFKIPIQAGDFITFSSIGFKTVSYKVPDTITTNYRVLVSMVEDTILLKEAVVTPWPINRTVLKTAMLDMKTEKEIVAPYAGFRRIEGDPEEPEPTVMNPISFIFNKLSKKARQQKKIEKYREMLQEDAYYEKP